ncbi:MAG: hypothetical protein Q9199_002394 [Rusavskia elegans]
MTDIHQQALATRTASLFNSAEYSDLNITCGERTFHVHRCVLCPASKFFATACGGNFQVDLYLKSSNGPLDLPEDDPDAVDRMLTYFYTADYDDTDHEGDPKTQEQHGGSLSPGTTKNPVPLIVPVDVSSLLETSSNASDALNEAAKAPVHVKVSALANNALVYALADKYNLFLLKDLAQTKFEVRAADEWAAEDIISILPKVYTTTPDSDRGLRRIMLDVCLRSMEHLMCHKNFRTMLKGDASMCFDVLDAVQMRSEEREFDGQKFKALDAKLKRVIEWTKTQERVFKSVIEARTTCSACSRPLDLSEKARKYRRQESPGLVEGKIIVGHWLHDGGKGGFGAGDGLRLSSEDDFAGGGRVALSESAQLVADGDMDKEGEGTEGGCGIGEVSWAGKTANRSLRFLRRPVE